MNILNIIAIICICISRTQAWDTVELEIFDLVEEINENFYDLMGISQNATLQEVKRAFRSLSIVLHPDKNDAEDANIKFRNLVSVYDVIKDSEKREKYDKVLKNGLPNWRSGLYYYRHFRKMGLMEMSIILFLIITIGQYIISWAVYAEKKYTAEQIFGTRLKKLQKKNKTNMNIENILNEIPTPSIFNTLPFQIPKFIWNSPRLVKETYQAYSEQKRNELLEKEKQQEEEERLQQLEEEILKQKEEAKGLRKRKVFVAPEKTDEELLGYSSLVLKTDGEDGVRPVVHSKTPISGGLWTDDDLIELVRLVKKYPGGTTDRWEIIAEIMNRSVPEVTFMAAKMKENVYRLPGQSDSIQERILPDQQKKSKTKNIENQIIIPESNWSQQQQQALETAIVKYPKGGSADRWQKIANCVPGKTKEECMLRYKYLVTLVKKQKESEQPEEVMAKNETGEESSAVEVENVKSEITDNSDGSHASNKSVVVVEDANGDDEGTTITVTNDDEICDSSKGKGKPKNKRKERKKQMELCLEDYEFDE